MKQIKVLVWDLDNTLWNGILTEGDPVVLRPGVQEVLEQLDQRGVLLSIASKNDAEPALAVLRRLGVDKFFLCPQISWSPKSEALLQITANLNIGLDTIAFIDDSPFERAQVHNALPEVRVFNASECGSLLARPEFQVSSTGGSKRREVYQQNQLRTTTAKNFRNYVEFLHECNIRVFIKKLECQDLDRVRELSQRTNQMNFSEDRFTHQQLTSMLETEAMNAFVIDCQDKFGSYGTVGFIAVDQTANRMVSFMLSCRVQSKRIEHAILTHLLDKYSHADFRVNYQKTSSNAFSGKVFDDFMFEAEGLNTLVFRVGWEIPDDGIITVIEK